MEENQNKTNNTENEEQAKGWKDVYLNQEMPLGALIDFLNILNQRLCTIENLITVKADDGEELTLTRVYELQSEAEAKKQQQMKED